MRRVPGSGLLALLAFGTASVALVFGTASAASGEIVTYMVRGNVDSIVLSSLPPAEISLGDAFEVDMTIDTEALTVLGSGVFQTQADVALRIGSYSLNASDQSAFVVIDCTFGPCELSIERPLMGNTPLPFAGTNVGQIGFTAGFLGLSGIGPEAPLAPDGLLFVTTCVPPSGCLVNYTATGGIVSADIVSHVPTVGPGGLVALAALLALSGGARRLGAGAPRRGRQAPRTRRRNATTHASWRS